MRVLATTLMLVAVAHAQPPEPMPPEAPAVPEPVAVITGPKDAVAGTLIRVTATGSKNAVGYAWLVTPDLGYEVSASGRTIIFATPRPGTYTFVLAVSGPNGKVSITRSTVTLRQVDIEVDEPPASPGPPPQATPMAKVQAIDPAKAAVAALKKVLADATLKTDAARLASELRVIAGGCISRTIDTPQKYENALANMRNRFDASRKGLIDAADDAVDGLVGNVEDYAKLHDSLHSVARILEGKKE